MQKENFVIIITGPTCTGKSTLAKKISDKFQIPVISRDEIKESLFDNIGWKDREWSKKLGKASFELMYQSIKKMLNLKKPFIIESPLNDELDTPKFLSLKKQFDFYPIQINCKCNGKILFERFKQRSESGDRHPGHVDHLNYDEYKTELLKGSRIPLKIGGNLIDFDSTDLSKIDYENIFEQIEQYEKTKQNFSLI